MLSWEEGSATIDNTLPLKLPITDSISTHKLAENILVCFIYVKDYIKLSTKVITYKVSFIASSAVKVTIMVM